MVPEVVRSPNNLQDKSLSAEEGSCIEEGRFVLDAWVIAEGMKQKGEL